MVLGKLPVPGRPTIWITVGQGPAALAVGAGGGCLDIFTLIYLFFPLSPSLWETARYSLKYCLKGPLNPKPTNQPTLFPLLVIYVYTRSLTKRKRVFGPKRLSLWRNKLYWLRSKYIGFAGSEIILLMLTTISSRAMDAIRNIVTGLISIHLNDRY